MHKVRVAALTQAMSLHGCVYLAVCLGRATVLLRGLHWSLQIRDTFICWLPDIFRALYPICTVQMLPKSERCTMMSSPNLSYILWIYFLLLSVFSLCLALLSPEVEWPGLHELFDIRVYDVFIQWYSDTVYLYSDKYIYMFSILFTVSFLTIQISCFTFLLDTGCLTWCFQRCLMLIPYFFLLKQ